MNGQEIHDVATKAANRAIDAYRTAAPEGTRAAVPTLPDWLKPVLIEFGKNLLTSLLTSMGK